MKKFINVILFFLITIFFCMPICCHADVPTSLSYHFKTTIENWNDEDELVFHCSTSELFDSVLITYGEENLPVTSCDTISFQEIDFGDYLGPIVIEETFVVTDFNQDSVSITPGFVTIESDFDDTDIKDYIFQNYSYDEYSALIDLSPWENLTLDDLDVVADSIDFGAIHFPIFFVKYQFVVRGDLADPSGQFLFTVEEEEDPLSFSTGDSVLFSEDSEDYAIKLSLSDMKELLEVKPEINYSGVYEAQDYAVTLLNLSGEELASIQEDEDGRWGIIFEVEARNDSTIANTGLLYDMGPFFLLAIVFIGFLFIFMRNKVRENKEIIDDEIL